MGGAHSLDQVLRDLTRRRATPRLVIRLGPVTGFVLEDRDGTQLLTFTVPGIVVRALRRAGRGRARRRPPGRT